MHGAGDVRIDDVPDPSILEPTDAIFACDACLYLRRSGRIPRDGRPRVDKGDGAALTGCTPPL
jgi:hypothetical protein